MHLHGCVSLPEAEASTAADRLVFFPLRFLPFAPKKQNFSNQFQKNQE